MTNQPLVPAALLALDPAKPDEAARLRIGIATLAGWTYSTFSDDWQWCPPNAAGAVCVHELPSFESSLDAALTLPIEEGAEWDIIIFPTGRTAVRIPVTVSSTLRLADPDYEKADNPSWAVCRAWLAFQMRISPRHELAANETEMK